MKIYSRFSEQEYEVKRGSIYQALGVVVLTLLPLPLASKLKFFSGQLSALKLCSIPLYTIALAFAIAFSFRRYKFNKEIAEANRLHDEEIFGIKDNPIKCYAYSLAYDASIFARHYI